MKPFIKVLLTITTIAFLASLTGCSSSGGGGYRGHTNYGTGVGYGGYYGRQPWGHHPGYIGGGIGPGIDDGPVAVQMPEMGRPDMGGMDMDMGMGMDMGGFDF